MLCYVNVCYVWHSGSGSGMAYNFFVFGSVSCVQRKYAAQQSSAVCLSEVVVA